MKYSWIATSSYNTAYSGCRISSSQRRSVTYIKSALDEEPGFSKFASHNLVSSPRGRLVGHKGQKCIVYRISIPQAKDVGNG
jgi:hypothetical protein